MGWHYPNAGVGQAIGKLKAGECGVIPAAPKEFGNDAISDPLENASYCETYSMGLQFFTIRIYIALKNSQSTDEKSQITREAQQNEI